MLNRKIPPLNSDIKETKILNPDKKAINNQVSLYSIKDNNHPVIKFDIICNSGTWFEQNKGVSSFAGKMLRGGTKTLSNTEIEEKLDFFGCNLNINLKRDFCHLSILTLNKYFGNILKILEDIIFNSSFPKSYFEIQKQIVKDKILLDDSKNSTLAIKKLQELIFGKTHPYGIKLNTKDIDDLNLEDIKKYYKNNLFSNCEMFISGGFKNDDLNIIKKTFNSLKYNSIKQDTLNFDHKPSKLEISKKESIQDSVIMGKSFPIKTHQDFINLTILNEILGGYFGSRLMSNIREKSGYTYGIYSRILVMKESSIFYIASEVSRGYANKVCKEIKKEINKLRTEFVDKKELESLKQYMKGKFLLSMDGIYAMMDNFINVHNFGLDNSYYSKLFEAIDNITPQDLKNLSQKYLDYDSFNQVIIG